MVVCMDHYTPLSIRTHVDWPVPVLLYDSRGVARPSGQGYSEANAEKSVAENGGSPISGARFFHYFIRGAKA